MTEHEAIAFHTKRALVDIDAQWCPNLPSLACMSDTEFFEFMRLHLGGSPDHTRMVLWRIERGYPF